MTWLDWLIILIIASALVCAGIYIVKRKKKGCTGCCSNCSACVGCKLSK